MNSTAPKLTGHLAIPKLIICFSKMSGLCRFTPNPYTETVGATMKVFLLQLEQWFLRWEECLIYLSRHRVMMKTMPNI